MGLLEKKKGHSGRKDRTNECGVTIIEEALNCFVYKPMGETYKENIVLYDY